MLDMGCGYSSVVEHFVIKESSGFHLQRIKNEKKIYSIPDLMVYTSAVPALGRLRQKNHRFDASLGYSVSQIKKKKRKLLSVPLILILEK